MQYNATNIITGIFVLFVFSYILVTAFTYIYLGLLKEDHKPKNPKLFLATALVSLAWIISTFVSIIFASSYGAVVFAVISLLFIFGSSYFFANKMLKLSMRHNVIYSFFAAVLFNPAWLIALGIL